MNCEDTYYVEGFLHNICPCAFGQLGLITGTRNEFVGTVAVAERYTIIIDVQKKESKKQPFRTYLHVKLAD